VQSPESLETAAGPLRDRWDEIGRRDTTLLEVRGVLGAEFPPVARPSGVNLRDRSSGSVSSANVRMSIVLSKIDLARYAGGVATRCSRSIETYEGGHQSLPDTHGPCVRAKCALAPAGGLTWFYCGERLTRKLGGLKAHH